MKNCLIVKAHKSSFPDPIILKKGEKVSIGGEYSEDPDWPNWIECKNQGGKKGWVPKQYLKISGKWECKIYLLCKRQKTDMTKRYLPLL